MLPGICDLMITATRQNHKILMVTIYPGGMRELHWHQNANEWQYYLGGKGRMTVLGSGWRARTMDFGAGDVRLRAENSAPLHREHGRREPAFPRDLQSPSLYGSFGL